MQTPINRIDQYLATAAAKTNPYHDAAHHAVMRFMENNPKADEHLKPKSARRMKHATYIYDSTDRAARALKKNIDPSYYSAVVNCGRALLANQEINSTEMRKAVTAYKRASKKSKCLASCHLAIGRVPTNATMRVEAAMSNAINHTVTHAPSILNHIKNAASAVAGHAKSIAGSAMEAAKAHPQGAAIALGVAGVAAAALAAHKIHKALTKPKAPAKPKAPKTPTSPKPPKPFHPPGAVHASLDTDIGTMSDHDVVKAFHHHLANYVYAGDIGTMHFAKHGHMC